MTVGNLVALLAMGVVLWAVFGLFGDPWETRGAQLVTYSPPQVDVAGMPAEAPLLPDRMQVGSIPERPAVAN